MTTLTLVIGNKNYSSWSLRPWLLLTHAGIDFDEVRLPLFTEVFHRTISRYTPSGKVPVLLDGELAVWDSLAICEYIAEKFPGKALWPLDAAARARARSLCAEMHSGFTALRSHMPMNIRANFAGQGRRRDVMRDIERIVQAWGDCRSRHGSNGSTGAAGPFLFGTFSCADAMYAPVCSRLTTYGVALPQAAQQYVQTIMTLPAMQAWVAAAKAETDVLDEDELYAPPGN